MAVDTIGTPLKRKEDPRFITGTGSFLDDVRLGDVAHAAILRSPYAHARIRGIETAAAQAMPAVASHLCVTPVGRFLDSGRPAGVRQRSA